MSSDVHKLNKRLAGQVELLYFHGEVSFIALLLGEFGLSKKLSHPSVRLFSRLVYSLPVLQGG